jgi:hypothetical protein
MLRQGRARSCGAQRINTCVDLSLTSHIMGDPMVPESLFEKFAPILCNVVPPVKRDPRLLIDEQGLIKIYYAPFEYVNRDARVVLVGITPGPTQMVNANNEARRALKSGKSAQDAMRAAKDTAAFSGEPMRSNLIKQINHWGIERWLGLSDAAALFSTDRHLVQTTSLLRYPVFVNDSDYGGTPDMIKDPLLKRYLIDYFVSELAELPDAVFLGLGPKVQGILDRLVLSGAIAKDRVIGGMLHPSGNNTYRVTYLAGSRGAAVPHATNPAPYDEGRRAFKERFLA